MEIKNINTNSNRNMQLISTFSEKNQHSYIDLLEFRYSVDGKEYSVRDLFKQIFETEQNIDRLKDGLKTALESIQNIQTLTADSLDLMDTKTNLIQQKLDELEDKIKILL